MADIRERLAALDRVRFPGAWMEAANFPARPPKRQPLTRRVGVVLVALAVTAAATTFLVRAFRSAPTHPRPVTPSPVLAAANGVIAYASIDKKGGFWTINPDGAARTLVHVAVPGGVGVGVPSWSPDGSRITFESETFDKPPPKGGNWDIFTANADGNDAVRLTFDGASYDPAWSPDGRRIAYTHGANYDQGSIWTMNADGSDPQRLTLGFHPAWSPDGTELAFVSMIDRNADIYVMRSDGSDIRRLTSSAAIEDQPKWSPDGRWIALTSQGTGDPGIYMMSPTGGGMVELLHDPDPSNLGMAWSPDGKDMAVVSVRGKCCDRNVYVLDLATGDLTTIGSPGAYGGPSWQPLLLNSPSRATPTS